MSDGDTETKRPRGFLALAGAIDRYNKHRVWLRKELTDHQPFLLLASFSFVVAAFLRDPTAAGFTALASVSFLGALTASIALDAGETPNLALILLFFSSIGYGFALLFVVAVVIVIAVPGALLGLGFAGSLLLLMLGVVSILELLWRLRRGRPS